MYTKRPGAARGAGAAALILGKFALDDLSVWGGSFVFEKAVKSLRWYSADCTTMSLPAGSPTYGHGEMDVG